MTISVNSKKKQVKKSFDELLTDLRTSNSEKVRYNAARILGEMGDFSAVEPLIDVLKNDKNHQRNVIGTGIGLSIVKETLEKHSFSYGVKSTKNTGSNFYFEVKK